MEEITLKIKGCKALITQTNSGYNASNKNILIEVLPEKDHPLHSSYEVLETKKENGKENDCL